MKKAGIILLTVFAIILEVLPYGTVMIFAPSPSDRIKETCSYFSLTPVGYAHVTPFVTAMLTCILLVLEIAESVTKNVYVRKTLWFISFAAVITSLGAILFGFEYYNITGGLITVVLAAECILVTILSKNR